VVKQTKTAVWLLMAAKSGQIEADSLKYREVGQDVLVTAAIGFSVSFRVEF
jgi:hypothetical protein